MRRATPIVGLDCSGRTLRAVRALRHRGALIIQASTSVRRNAPDGPLDPADLGRLRAALRRSGVGTRGIIAAAPRELLGMTSMELPGSATEEEIREPAAKELARLVGGEPDDLEVAWVAMPARRGGGREVAITGCVHDAAEEFIERCAESGIEVVGLQPETRALSELITVDADEDGESAILRACVLVDWTRAIVVVNEDDRPVFERVLPVGGLDACAAAIAKRAHVDDQEVVEHLLFSCGLRTESADGESALARTTLSEPVGDLLDEIDRTVRYACARFRHRSVAEVLVIGEGARVPGLTAAIAERLEASIGPDCAPLTRPALAVARGLAGLAAPAASEVEFVPPRRRAHRERQRRARSWFAGLGIYAAALGAGAVAMGIAVPPPDDDRVQHIARIDARLADLARTEADVAGHLAALRSAIDVDRTVRAHPDWSIAMLLIAEATGEDVVLSRIGIPRVSGPVPYQATITGFATTQAGVTSFVARLESTGLFSSVTLVESRREAFRSAIGVAFRVEAKLGHGTDEPGNEVTP